MSRCQVTIEESHVALLKAQGNGSVSRGIFMLCRMLEARIDVSPKVKHKSSTAAEKEFDSLVDCHFELSDKFRALEDRVRRIEDAALLVRLNSMSAKGDANVSAH